MELKFTVQTKINRSVSEVFEAVINNEKLSGYFVKSSSGPLEEGKTLIWSWSNHGDLNVSVKQIIKNQKLVLEWLASDGNYNTTFSIHFEEIKENTSLIKVTEHGWRPTQEGLNSSYDNCDGWRHMLMCLKAYLEHGIDLRI